MKDYVKHLFTVKIQLQQVNHVLWSNYWNIATWVDKIEFNLLSAP